MGIPVPPDYTVNPGDQRRSGADNSVIATGGEKPPTEADKVDQQMMAHFAQVIGKDPAVLTDADKGMFRRLDRKADSFTETAIGDALKKKGAPLTVEELTAAENRADQARAAAGRPPGASDIGTWTIAEDTNGKTDLLNTKTSAVKPVEGLQKSGTAEKKSAADEKAQGPARDAIAYADDYLKNGSGPVGPDGKPLNGKVEYTGAGDEALMEKFFDLAKPSSGFRMSQPQIDMLKNAQGWQNSIAAKARHVTTGTWFSDQQRNQIVSTIKQIARTKGSSPASVSPPPGTTSVIKVQKWGRDAQGNPVPIQ